jgi:hypothetical protein
MHFLVKIASVYTPLSPFHAAPLVFGPLLYLLYTADIATSPESTTATYADDTSVLASDSDPTAASLKLQTHLLAIQHWLHQWRMHTNPSKSLHVTFTTRTGMCPPVQLNNVQLPRKDHVKYLGLHLDGRLT